MSRRTRKKLLAMGLALCVTVATLPPEVVLATDASSELSTLRDGGETSTVEVGGGAAGGEEGGAAGGEEGGEEGGEGQEEDKLVYAVWATIVSGEPTEIEIADTQPEGKTLIAKYIQNGTYVYQEEDARISFALNNAVLDASTVDMDTAEFTVVMAGDSIAHYKGIDLSSNAEVFPAYTGEMEIEAVEGFFTSGPYAEDPEQGIFARPYDMAFVSDTRLEKVLMAGNVEVKAGVTLTLGAFEDPEAEGEADGTIGAKLEADKLVVNGKIVMEAADDDDKPTAIEIRDNGQLIVGEAGSIEGTDATILMIREGATVTGLQLYERVDTPEGMEVREFESGEDGRPGEFTYDAEEEKWISRDMGGNPFAGENKFVVEFDEWRTEESGEEPQASITVNGTPVNPGEAIDFEAENEIEFKWTVPEERKDYEHIVRIEFEDGRILASDAENEDEKLEITAEGFSFTPADSTSFIVRVIWCEFDSLVPNFDEVRVDMYANGGKIEIAEKAENSAVAPWDEKLTRSIFKNTVFEGEGQLTISLVPGEHGHLDRVEVQVNGERKVYVTTLSGADNEILISDEASGFTEKDGVYTFTISESDKDNLIFINADFSVDILEIFDDVVAGTWEAKVISFVYNNGIMKGKGVSPNNADMQFFDPKASMTRGEFATMLYNYEGKPEVEYADAFPDVPAKAYYAKPIQWVLDSGIAKGTGDGLFKPNEGIQREQIAVMLYKYAKYKGYDVSIADEDILDRFGDSEKISSWAVEAMKWATNWGIMKGSAHEVPLLSPTSAATRAECAAMIKNFLEKTAPAPQVEE